MSGDKNTSSARRILSIVVTVISSLLLGGVVAFIASRLYFGGLREIGRAPEGLVWLSSGDEYGRVSGMVFLLLVTILGIAAFGLINWLLIGRLKSLPQEEDIPYLLGCLPIVIGCALVTLLTLNFGGR
ncbi:MAG: hypothetical protein L0287_29240 [Anaerolineae bacterium]|nr:hypothetical protein [Anaerolineae bacterium]